MKTKPLRKTGWDEPIKKLQKICGGASRTSVQTIDCSWKRFSCATEPNSISFSTDVFLDELGLYQLRAVCIVRMTFAVSVLDKDGLGTLFCQSNSRKGEI